MMKRPVFVRRGFSLVELMITMTILAILISFSAPSVMHSIEQTHADLVGAGLRMIHTSQRFYWLENRTYATDLQTLIDDGLIDHNLSATAQRYEYSIATADAESFTVQARRRLFDEFGSPIYNGAWQGTLTIDETGVLAGHVHGPPNPITGHAPQLTPAF